MPGFFVMLAGLALTVISIVAAQGVPPVKEEIGVSAYSFGIDQVTLGSGRWRENQDRTLTYLKFVDINRLLVVFRSNHKLSTAGATPNGGWDEPSFPFRGHIQGHFLTAWSQCYSQLRDAKCRDQATTLVAELLKCQSNNAAAGFSSGYLSGFPESDITALETGSLSNGNVPYYVLHKILAGLLDVWRYIGDPNAKTALLSLAAWVDARTGKLSYNDMQRVLGTEFGGMSEVLADIYHQTGDTRWLTVAKRFEHASVLVPLASRQDRLDGLHANTQVPKWIGAAREYKMTGNTSYQTIARNAWDITISAHTYAIGGNSQAEHFHQPNAISTYLTTDTVETCNSYNMLKLTRELWMMDPNNTAYFDFYERTLMNHLVGAQDPSSSHGHITYFSSLNPGGRRGLGPAWGGGTWSTDYDSFWCCQGSGMETNTKLMDSIYFYDESSLFVNLFVSSVLSWSQRNIKVTQTTEFPVEDTTVLQVSGNGTWTMHIRIPLWTSGAVITVNGESVGVSSAPGMYASISRAWSTGDTVEVQLPMKLRLLPANDNEAVAAVAYGPVVLSGNYGSTSLKSNPKLLLSSLQRTGGRGLEFIGSADGKTVNLGPYYDAQGFNYVVYWAVDGSLPSA